MDISLTKLPWYAQVGAFVVLSVVGVGMFYYYYEMPARAEIASHESTIWKPSLAPGPRPAEWWTSR